MGKEIQSGCWVDVYACACFAGELKRLYGPTRFTAPRRGSMIVGPQATLISRTGGTLGPKQIVADLADRKWRGRVGNVEVSVT